VLAEVLPNWIAGLHFPRSMRWNQTDVAFSRPIRWLAALLDEHVVPFTYAGLESGRITRGPRPAGSPNVALAAASDYRSALTSYGVFLDPEARREEIARQAQEVVNAVGGTIPDDPDLVEEVANLVEVPTALLGSFEARYLSLPQDVLIAVMKKHQRYFPVLDPDGQIMAHFVAVRNGGHEHLDLVRAGNEDVIRARYADAEYFYNQDRRKPLEEHRAGLEKLTFQSELGSMLDKSNHLEQLAPWVGERLGYDAGVMEDLTRAAYLCKADLATQMVVEMTSLQGIMGREYALSSDESQAVADAIFEHYLPRYAGDRLPTTQPGVALAIADRADSLTGLFAVGMEPTGSADPYGLRRAAAGLVQILLEHGISLSLRDLMMEAAAQLPLEVDTTTIEGVLDFVEGRLEGTLREGGLAYDVVAAALADRGENPTRALEAAQQLSEWVARDDWSLLLDNYARCVRITRDHPRFELDPEALEASEGQILFDALVNAEAELDPASSVDELMGAIVHLVPHIQRFFDEVLVMAEDEDLRRARLALLQRVAALADGIVDLRKLEGF
jgi:glycyl-tRNA synthetase